MLLAVDIGNSNIKFGIFDNEQLVSRFSIPTKSLLTPEDLKLAVGHGLDQPIKNAIVCSVVSEADPPIAAFLEKATGNAPVFVRNDWDFGLKVDYQPLSSLGTDRLVNAFAAVEKFGAPSIVCSFGTATTFDVIDPHRELLGGVIAPGMKTMARALHLNTSQLPEIELSKPEGVLGNSTLTSMSSGIFYGHVGMVEGIIRRLNEETGVSGNVIATGGFADLIAQNTAVIDTVDPDLLLDGLRILHNKSKTS